MAQAGLPNQDRVEDLPRPTEEVRYVTYEPDNQKSDGDAFSVALFVIFDQLRNL